MGHVIFSLHLGVGHSVLLQLEGVGHVFSNHHILKCSGPPPLYLVTSPLAFFEKMGQFPGVGTHKLSKCPRVETKNEGKCPAPGIVAFQNFCSFLPGPSRRLAPVIKCSPFLSFFQRYIVRDISLT